MAGLAGTGRAGRIRSEAVIWPAKSDAPRDAGRAEKRLVVERDAVGHATGRAATGPPADLLEQAVWRVGLVAGAVVGVSVLEALVSHLWPWLTRPDYPGDREKWDLIGNLLVVTVSALTLAATRWRRLANLTRLRIGVGYLVIIAYLVSLTDHADHFWAGGHRHHGIPWVTALILVFPVLVPMPPLRALVLGLVMAATSPLAMWTHVVLLGYEPPQPAALLDAFPFLFAFVAAFAAAVVHQLGREVGRARRLGAYTLESQLGGGGMGEVWIASHRFLARPAAVKLIRPATSGRDPRTLFERFEREAQATAALKSPHTVHVYDFGTSDDGRLFYAMELLDGVDLETLIARDGPQPAERVIHWLRQACHSLGEAHDAGLVHRDIKPANLYACRYGRDYDFIKVLDFGLVTSEAIHRLCQSDPHGQGAPDRYAGVHAARDGHRQFSRGRTFRPVCLGLRRILPPDVRRPVLGWLGRGSRAGSCHAGPASPVCKSPPNRFPKSSTRSCSLAWRNYPPSDRRARMSCSRAWSAVRSRHPGRRSVHAGGGKNTPSGQIRRPFEARQGESTPCAGRNRVPAPVRLMGTSSSESRWSGWSLGQTHSCLCRRPAWTPSRRRSHHRGGSS